VSWRKGTQEEGEILRRQKAVFLNGKASIHLAKKTAPKTFGGLS
jgi:hypothetical protein